MEESRRERVGGPFALSPKPRPSPFFLAHFSLCFPNYLKACYRLSTSFISKFLWYIFNLSVEHFWRFVIDQRGNGFGSTNFSTAFRLRNCPFFFLFFLLFQFLSYFLDVFFASLLSLTNSPLSPPHMLHTKGNGHFVLLRTIRLTIPRSSLTQQVRAALWSETDLYPVAIWLRRARGLMGRDEGKIARAPQPNPHSSLTPKTHK